MEATNFSAEVQLIKNVKTMEQNNNLCHSSQCSDTSTPVFHLHRSTKRNFDQVSESSSAGSHSPLKQTRGCATDLITCVSMNIAASCMVNDGLVLQNVGHSPNIHAETLSKITNTSNSNNLRFRNDQCITENGGPLIDVRNKEHNRETHDESSENYYIVDSNGTDNSVVGDFMAQTSISSSVIAVVETKNKDDTNNNKRNTVNNNSNSNNCRNSFLSRLSENKPCNVLGSTKTTCLSSKSTSSDLKPSNPSAGSTSSAVKPSNPSAGSTSSDVKPSNPSAESTSSDVKTSNPSAGSTSSAVKPSNPSAGSTNSAVESSTPAVEPSGCATVSSNINGPDSNSTATKLKNSTIELSSLTTESYRDVTEISCHMTESCSPVTEPSNPAALQPGRKVYGLRPRRALRRLWSGSKNCPAEANNGHKSGPGDTIVSGALSRLEDCPSSSAAKTEICSGKKSAFKHKSKSHGGKSNGSNADVYGSRGKPLSKYRRITANARERDRMKEINSAFATLRAMLPTFSNCRISSMTKYTTLQLAVNYIKGLSEMLEEAAPSNAIDNRKEYCPTFLHGNMGQNKRKDGGINVEDIPRPNYERPHHCLIGHKHCDFERFSNTMNTGPSFTTLADDNLSGLGGIDNMSDVCFTLDFMLD